MIEFHDVCVCYEPQKRHPVRSLDGLNLHIERGDWVFLVGPSGAGKSSLLKLIYAGTTVQSGRVIVDGQDISAIARGEVPALRRKIGIVFQDFQLLTEKTAWENVAFALRVIGTPQAQILREVPRALETVGLTHRAEALPHELSGGEQQRIAIARAIVNDPKILLADEPTGNLDPQTAREVGELLTKINRERGTTIVMATHDRVFVDQLQRRVVRLKTGRVIADENPGTYGHFEDAAELFTPPTAPTLPTARPKTEVVSAPPAPVVIPTPVPVAAPVPSPSPIPTPVPAPVVVSTPAPVPIPPSPPVAPPAAVEAQPAMRVEPIAEEVYEESPYEKDELTLSLPGMEDEGMEDEGREIVSEIAPPPVTVLQPVPPVVPVPVPIAPPVASPKNGSAGQDPAAAIADTYGLPAPRPMARRVAPPVPPPAFDPNTPSEHQTEA